MALYYLLLFYKAKINFFGTQNVIILVRARGRYGFVYVIVYFFVHLPLVYRTPRLGGLFTIFEANTLLPFRLFKNTWYWYFFGFKIIPRCPTRWSWSTRPQPPSSTGSSLTTTKKNSPPMRYQGEDKSFKLLVSLLIVFGTRNFLSQHLQISFQSSDQRLSFLIYIVSVSWSI